MENFSTSPKKQSPPRLTTVHDLEERDNFADFHPLEYADIDLEINTQSMDIAEDEFEKYAHFLTYLLENKSLSDGLGIKIRGARVVLKKPQAALSHRGSKTKSFLQTFFERKRKSEILDELWSDLYYERLEALEDGKELRAWRLTISFYLNSFASAFNLLLPPWLVAVLRIASLIRFLPKFF